MDGGCALGDDLVRAIEDFEAQRVVADLGLLWGDPPAILILPADAAVYIVQEVAPVGGEDDIIEVE